VPPLAVPISSTARGRRRSTISKNSSSSSSNWKGSMLSFLQLVFMATCTSSCTVSARRTARRSLHRKPQI
jgi:hypothetical protein